jgi:hypothetical protein
MQKVMQHVENVTVPSINNNFEFQKICICGQKNLHCTGEICEVHNAQPAFGA